MMKKLTLLALTLGFLASCIETKVDDGAAVPSGKRIIEFKINGEIGDINTTTREIDFILPFGTDVTALSPEIKISDDAIIFPASGASVDFTNPVVYTVRAENGAAVDYTVTVEIMPLQITDVTPEAVSELAATQVSLMGSFGDSGNVVQLFAEGGVLLGADITPVTQTNSLIEFNTPATIPAGVYTIKVKSGATVSDAATKTLTAQSSAAEILTFVDALNTYTLTGTQFKFNYPIGTNLTAIAPTITLSAGATVSPASGSAQNLSSAVTYTVTAANGTTTGVYTALATRDAMAISNVSPATVMNNAVQTITVTGTFGSTNSVEVLKSDDTASGITPSINIQTTTQIKFTIPIGAAPGDYKVKVTTGADNIISTQQFAVTAPNTAIASVTIDGVAVTPVGDAYVYVIPISSSAVSSAITPAIVLSDAANANITPAGAQNFATASDNTITYEVTAADGFTTKEYTIKVTDEVMAITAVNPSSFGNGALQEITVDGTFAASGSTISISADDFSTSFMGTVTSQSATEIKFTIPAGTPTGTYEVMVLHGTKSVISIQTFNIVSSAKVISAATIETNPATITEGTHTIAYTMPYVNANRMFTPVFTNSAGSTVTPIGAQDFTAPVAYTVTAADASTQVYNFTINFPALSLTSVDINVANTQLTITGVLPNTKTGCTLRILEANGTTEVEAIDGADITVTSSGTVFTVDVVGTLTAATTYNLEFAYTGETTVIKTFTTL